MRKALFVLFGLVLIAAALGTGYFRHIHEPRTTIQHRAGQQAQRAPQATTRGVTAEPRPAAPTATAPVPTLSFDTVINILNVVVGIVGIWLSIAGMRMQRQAMAVMQRHQQR